MTQKTTILWGLFGLQALCCAYFLVDITYDLFGSQPVPTGLIGSLTESDRMEALVTLALFLSLAFTGTELARMLRRQAKIEDQLQIASGAFADLLETRFKEWDLTQAERDVAVLALKGYAIADMARLRDTAQGTVKAQCAALYRKAGVASRLELLSLFLDDLIAEDLIKTKAAASA